jgi:copper(I)-binding protein
MSPFRKENDAVIRMSRRVAALAIAGAVVIVAPVISGCGAGSEPQSSAPTQLTDGVNASVPKGADVSQVDIRNMFILGPPPGQKLAAGSAAPLYASLINRVAGTDDRLVSVTSPSFTEATITGSAVQLPGDKAVQLVGLAGQPPVVVLKGIAQQLIGGESLSLTLQFERAGSITVMVPVVPQRDEYSTFSPAPSPTPTVSAATPANKKTPGEKKSPKPGTPTPTNTPTS